MLLSVCCIYAIESRVKFESNWLVAINGLMATGGSVSAGLIASKKNCIEITGIFDPLALLPLTDVETHTELSFYSLLAGYSYRFTLFNKFITIAPGLLFGFSDRPRIYGAWGFEQTDEPRPFAGQTATRWISATAGIQTDIEFGKNKTKFVLSGRGLYAKPSEFMLNISLGIALVN